MYTLDYYQCPACLGHKSWRWPMCERCFGAFGYNRALWPVWLRFLVRDNDRCFYRDCKDSARLIYGYGDLDSFEAHA